MERKINSKLYILAFFISLIIFGIGFWTGSLYDAMLNDELESKMYDVSFQTLSFQLIYSMDENLEYCDYYLDELKKIEIETDSVGNQVSLIEETKGKTDVALKDKYFLLETVSFNLHRKINEKCGINTKEILYFYSNEKCGDECVLQGRELLKLKNNKDVRIYSYDCTINSAIANSLCNKYNVMKYPTIVIKDKNYGFLDYDGLMEIV